MANKGKYSKKKSKNTKPLIFAVIVLALLLGVLIWVASVIEEEDIPLLELDPQQMTSDPVQTEQTRETTASALEQNTVQIQEAIQLGQGLVIEGITNYAGVYMEDGSDETVTNVMMLILRNSNGQDLQLARINVVYEDFIAQFEASNLPSGEAVVLLEKTRASKPEGEYQSLELTNAAFFQTSMSLQDDKLEIAGGNGYLDVTNISGEDITGTVRVFYKNCGQDLLYGGITYMATLNNGVAAGETIRVLTGHYSEGNCRIVNVALGE